MIGRIAKPRSAGLPSVCRWVKFIVADSGRGIASEDMPHIFERFYRAKSVRRQRGTGLGLAVAQWIANEHGGHIEVQSTSGTGTTVTAWLPSDERLRLLSLLENS